MLLPRVLIRGSKQRTEGINNVEDYSKEKSARPAAKAISRREKTHSTHSNNLYEYSFAKPLQIIIFIYP